MSRALEEFWSTEDGCRDRWREGEQKGWSKDRPLLVEPSLLHSYKGKSVILKQIEL